MYGRFGGISSLMVHIVWVGNIMTPEKYPSCQTIFPISITWNYPPNHPQPVTVTTRIVPFLVGNFYKPSFVTVTGWGVDLKYSMILVITMLQGTLSFDDFEAAEKHGSHQHFLAFEAGERCSCQL